MYKNVASQIIAVYAHDNATNSPKTGDAANITAYISKDGGADAQTNDVNPTELDSSTQKGVYLFALTQDETNADLVVLTATTTTDEVTIEPVVVYPIQSTIAGTILVGTGNDGEFATLISKVAGYLNREDLNAIIPDFINQAMHRVERIPGHNWRCMETKSAPTQTNDTLPIPTRYKETKAIFVTANSRKYLLTKDGYRHMIASYPYGSGEPGQPTVFSMLNADSAFYVRPYPDATYTFEHVYYAYTADLSAGTDTNWWTLNAWEILLYGALLEAEPYLMNDSRVPIWKGYYDVAVKMLKDAEIAEEFGGSPQSVAAPHYVV